MDQSNNLALICTICNNQFNQVNRLPRMIPDCGHSYCEECIWKNVINSKHTFKCPEDGSSSLINNSQIVLCSRDSINNFPKNISILKIIEHHTSKQKIDSFGVQQLKPFQMAEVVVSARSLPTTQSFSNKNLVPNSSSELKPQLSSQKYSQKPLICSAHMKPQDLGCLQCQEKICAHCAIFGNHKNHTVIPEDEMKKRNKNGIDQMIGIKQKIEVTKEDFIRQMEDNFSNIICGKIESQKSSFKQTTRHKFQEFLKLLEYSEQRCYDEIEKFFAQVEEKFRKFKNHSFKETYDKIYNWNIMVDTMKSQSENLEQRNQVDFDLFLHLEKLLVSGNELEIEYNNLLQFPIKLIANYLENICFSFSDSIPTNIENCMSIQFVHNESDVIQRSIEHLTFENQKDILSNTQFFQLTPLEVKSILGTTNQTPTQQFLQSHQALNHKQSMKASGLHINSRKNSLSSETSRQSSVGQRFNKGKVKEPTKNNKNEVTLDNVDTIVAELSSYRQKNIIPQLKESSISKDKLLLSNLENQVEFAKHTPINGSMFNSVVINSNESDKQHQIYPFFNDTDSVGRGQFENSQSNGIFIMNQQSSSSPQIQPMVQNISEIKMEGSGFFKKGIVPSVHDNCKFQAILEKQFTSDLKKSQVSQSDTNPFGKTMKNSALQSQQRSTYQTPFNQSRSRSPYRAGIADIDTSQNANAQFYDLNAAGLEIKSARSHYTNTYADFYGSGDNSYMKKSMTPTRQDRIVDSQLINKQSTNANNTYNYIIHPYSNMDLSKTLPSSRGGGMAGNNLEDTYSSTTASHLNSISKQSKKNNNSIKNNSLKFIKSPTKSNASSRVSTQQPQQQSPISQRRTNHSTYKKKSEKLQVILQKLRQNEYLDIIELVSEDVNDVESEELGAEIGKTRISIDSIKLVKNKIGDVGLKSILQGLEKSDQKIHTLNLTSNICTESCFDDILKHLHKNSNLKNIYLLNNNIQMYKNKDKLKSIQQLCNIHI